jgi:hypothetical protein
MKFKELIFYTTKREFSSLDLDNNKLVALTLRNANAIEALIEQDSNYPPNAKRTFDQIGKNANFSLDDFRKIIYQIADDNSTHTATPSREAIARYIYSPTTRFLERLGKPDYSLVDDINDYVFANVTLPSGRKAHVLSLSSKLCRYLEEWLWGNDNFAVYDSVVRNLLPYYIKQRGLTLTVNLGKSTYQQFMEEFNKISNGNKVRKHSIDHIIWYSYKDDPIRTAIGIALGK